MVGGTDLSPSIDQARSRLVVPMPPQPPRHFTTASRPNHHIKLRDTNIAHTGVIWPSGLLIFLLVRLWKSKYAEKPDVYVLSNPSFRVTQPSGVHTAFGSVLAKIGRPPIAQHRSDRGSQVGKSAEQYLIAGRPSRLRSFKDFPLR